VCPIKSTTYEHQKVLVPFRVFLSGRLIAARKNVQCEVYENKIWVEEMLATSVTSVIKFYYLKKVSTAIKHSLRCSFATGKNMMSFQNFINQIRLGGHKLSTKNQKLLYFSDDVILQMCMLSHVFSPVMFENMFEIKRIQLVLRFFFRCSD